MTDIDTQAGPEEAKALSTLGAKVWRSHEGNVRYCIGLLVDDPTRGVMLDLDHGEVAKTLATFDMPSTPPVADPVGFIVQQLCEQLYNCDDLFDVIPTRKDPTFVEWALVATDAATDEYESRRAGEQARRSQLRGRLGQEILTTVPEQVDWLVPGYLARRQVVKLDAREKTGKGTWNFYTIGCLEGGVNTAFGPGPADPMTSVILTEEPDESIREKADLFGVKRSRIIQGYELAGMSWLEKVTYLVDAAFLEGHGLVFVDNISRSAMIEDEAGVELARAVELLMDCLRGAGLSGIIDHHQRKTRGADHDMSRGGTGLAGATDINVAMFRTKRHDRRRRLSAQGRLRTMNWTRVVELSEDGRSYELVEDADDAENEAAALAFGRWYSLRELPDGFTVKDASAALGLSERQTRRQLDEFVAEGKLVQEEREKANAPIRYRRIPVGHTVPLGDVHHVQQAGGVQ